MVMLRFYDYVFYRVASSRFYQKVAPRTFCQGGFGVTTIAEVLNFITIISIICTIFDFEFTRGMAKYWVNIPIIIFNCFRFTEERYKVLNEQFKDEPNKKIKKYLLLLYLFISWFLFFFAIWLTKMK